MSVLSNYEANIGVLEPDVDSLLSQPLILLLSRKVIKLKDI